MTLALIGLAWLIIVAFTLALMRVAKQADERAAQFSDEWRRPR